MLFFNSFRLYYTFMRFSAFGIVLAGFLFCCCNVTHLFVEELKKKMFFTDRKCNRGRMTNVRKMIQGERITVGVKKK